MISKFKLEKSVGLHLLVNYFILRLMNSDAPNHVRKVRLNIINKTYYLKPIWEKQNIEPIFKSGDHYDTDNYRVFTWFYIYE